ncbi:MAG TPA: CHAD domain-containing protein [Patescibacteria group bacterium]|nr:CHAD domain-containing protein [Patescibacteria group bacterium]
MIPVETELKLRLVRPITLSQLMSHSHLQELAAGQSPVRQQLETTYYDTPSYRLLHNRLSFRLRHEGPQWIATVKAGGGGNGGLHQREEHNLVYGEPIPDISPFVSTSIGPRLLAALGEETLQPIFSTHFDRHTLQLTFPDGTQAELALDEGEITTPDQHQPLAEIELELKHGQVAHLLRLGAELSRTLPLLPETNSKWDRGARLADIPLPTAITKSPVITKADFAKDARIILSRLAISQLHYIITAQQHFIDFPEDPETLHQLRVSLRQFRAFLSFSQPLLSTELIAPVKEALRNWGQTLGELRETDVLLESWTHLALHLMSDQKKPHTALADNLKKTRLLLAEQLRDELASGLYTPLLLDLWRQLEEWPLTDDPIPVPPLAEYLHHRLAHWLQDMIAGEAPDLNDAQALHQLRIRGKKVRYVLEIISPFYSSKITSLLQRRLKLLQDHLGTMHDILTAATLLTRFVKPSSARLLHYDHGLLIGWQTAQKITALENFHNTWRRFKKTAKNWLDRHVSASHQ